jgi:hypothetical protein
MDAARMERTRLQDAIDAEESQRRLQEEADSRAATRRSMPTATAHPWAPASLAAGGTILGGLLANRWSARQVAAYNRHIEDLNTRWGAAVTRAQNPRLAPATRTTAANEAREMQREFERLTATGPGSHWPGIGMSTAAAETGFALPTIIDYTTSTPGSALRDYTLRSVDVVNNPGEVLGRYGLGLGLGYGIGEIGGRWPYRNVQTPTGYAAETGALPAQFRRSRRRR